MHAKRPISVAVVNDYQVVVDGVARMLEPFGDRVEVVELDVSAPTNEPVDIALHDTFSNVEKARNCNAQRLVTYSWNLDPLLISTSLARGASGYLSKRLPAGDLVEALERIFAGEIVVSEDAHPESDAGDWPGSAQGLTSREAEIIALITQGLSNQEIADRAYLSINTVKSYIRTSYQKMGVSSRSQAVLWGLGHGFRLRHMRETVND